MLVPYSRFEVARSSFVVLECTHTSSEVVARFLEVDPLLFRKKLRRKRKHSSGFRRVLGSGVRVGGVLARATCVAGGMLSALVVFFIQVTVGVIITEVVMGLRFDTHNKKYKCS